MYWNKGASITSCPPYKTSGFTLIEISVVLVIIGLILGGVVLGRNLVHAAEVRAQIKQIQDYQAAVSQFETKYDCIPGDCANFTSYFSSGTVNGNGDGLIENNWAFNNIDNSCSSSTLYQYSYDACDDNVKWSKSTEYQQFFVQLSLAGLIPGSFTATSGTNGPTIGMNVPALALNPSASFFAGDTSSFLDDDAASVRNPGITNYRHGHNALWMVACDINDAVDNYAHSPDIMHYWDDWCGVFLPSDLSAIDTKIDDGNPLSGNLIGFGGYGGNNNCLVGPDSYGNYYYDFTQTTAQCLATFVFN